MTSPQFSKPSETLRGEVQQQIGGVWRVVLTPNGTPVKDRSHRWTDDMKDAFRYSKLFYTAGGETLNLKPFLQYGSEA